MTIGNDECERNMDYERDENKRSAGRLKALKAGLDLAAPAAAFPAGSQGLVIGYASSARVIAPRRPLAQLTGSHRLRSLPSSWSRPCRNGTRHQGANT